MTDELTAPPADPNPRQLMQPEVVFSDAKIGLIRRTICPDATDDELTMFLHVCRQTGLDPILKQIYLVKRKGKMCVQVGIDGFRLVAERTGRYAGSDDAVFGPEDAQGRPSSATVTVYKMVGGQRCPFTATARWKEYFPGEGDIGFMWRKMPFGQLGKCAEALALRKACPAELGGAYVSEELEAPDSPTVSPDQIGVLNDLLGRLPTTKPPFDLSTYLGIFGLTDTEEGKAHIGMLAAADFWAAFRLLNKRIPESIEDETLCRLDETRVRDYLNDRRGK